MRDAPLVVFFVGEGKQLGAVMDWSWTSSGCMIGLGKGPVNQVSGGTD